MRKWARGRWAGVAAALALVISSPCAGQSRPELKVQKSNGSAGVVPVFSDQGYEAVPLWAFQDIDWSVASDGPKVTVTAPDSSELVLWAGNPFFRWHDRVRQLVSPPYLSQDSLRVPLQLFTDFLPQWFPERYAYDAANATLRVNEPSKGSTNADSLMKPDTLRPNRIRPVGGRVALRRPTPYDGKKVVVIDAGHGGIDPGAMSASGIKEKTVALAIAKDLQRILSKDPSLAVYMTRTTDRLIPLWTRGEEATKWKGTRPGVFVSIHCNSFPRTRSISGFEAYFLSEARTEHERRVAANENAPLQLEKGAHPSTDLDAILHQLRTLDYQHWSSLFAQMIEDDLAKVDPNPDRGVKQGPFAVLTNTMMPAVLVEVGYLSNPSEARLLARSSFQKKAAGAIAEAVKSFFRRYPPGSAAARTGEGG